MAHNFQTVGTQNFDPGLNDIHFTPSSKVRKAGMLIFFVKQD